MPRLAVIGGEKNDSPICRPGASVAEIHLYHPQPYRDDEGLGERLLTPRFFESVRNALVPDGLFVIQTDNRGYWKYIRKPLHLFFFLSERDAPWPDAPGCCTRQRFTPGSTVSPSFAANAAAL